MDSVFGLTPIDAALSAYGLNCSGQLSDFLFIQTRIGLVAFAIGFFWSLWQSTQEGNFKHFIVFLCISIVGGLLFIAPRCQEPAITSAVEIYNLNTNSKNTALSIKNSQTDIHTMPLILSFIEGMANVITIGIISILDNGLDKNIKFLAQPFGLQKLSLQANQFIHAPLADVQLREDVDNFIYAYYLPSLIMYQNTMSSKASSLADLHQYSPGELNISQWADLKGRLSILINNPAQQSRDVNHLSSSPWPQIKTILTQANFLRGNPQKDLDDQIMASIIRGRIENKSQGSWDAAGAIQTAFPYISGWACFCLYAVFPFLMLALVVVRQMSLFFRYLEAFVWIKSLNLCAAFSFYVSLIVARMQAQSMQGSNWFWDYPYYVVVASVILCLMPVLVLVGIRRGVGELVG